MKFVNSPRELGTPKSLGVFEIKQGDTDQLLVNLEHETSIDQMGQPTLLPWTGYTFNVKTELFFGTSLFTGAGNNLTFDFGGDFRKVIQTDLGTGETLVNNGVRDYTTTITEIETADPNNLFVSIPETLLSDLATGTNAGAPGEPRADKPFSVIVTLEATNNNQKETYQVVYVIRWKTQ